MKNKHKKIAFVSLSWLICSAIFLSLFVTAVPFWGKAEADSLSTVISGSSSFNAAATHGQTIDMYLIAGQSNASGNSQNVSQGVTVNEVLYIGEREQAIGASGMFCSNSVSVGLGINYNYMGPEYGMALKLRDNYSVNRPACIFKTAAGGTNLRDVTVGTYAERYGNWYPRSLWETAEHDGNSATGYLYYRFIENFKSAYNLLVEKGYTPVVKAFCWMQGESDRGAFSEYEQLIKIFIADMRKDIGNITGVDQSGLLFIMGEISPTFSEYSSLAGNKAFIEMQRNVAASCNPGKTATVDTSDLLINGVDANGNSIVLGSDRYHWNGADMRTLGIRFAECAIEYADKNFVAIEENDMCRIRADKTMFVDGEELNITVTPNSSKFYLSKFFVNGEDVTSSMSGNAYKIPSTSGNYTISIEANENAYFNITYEYDSTRGTYDRRKSAASKVYAGEEIVVVPQAFEGYEVYAVTFNGTPLVEGVNGRYVLEGGAQEDGVVKIDFRYPGEVVKNDGDSGCGKSDAVLIFSIMGALASAVFILKK